MLQNQGKQNFTGMKFIAEAQEKNENLSTSSGLTTSLQS